jgi:hypothetical protein
LISKARQKEALAAMMLRSASSRSRGAVEETTIARARLSAGSSRFWASVPVILIDPIARGSRREVVPRNVAGQEAIIAISAWLQDYHKYTCRREL